MNRIRITLIFSILLSFFSYKATAQGWEWAKNIGGHPDLFVNGQSIKADKFGHIYVSGNFNQLELYFDSTLIFDSGAYTVFIAKYDTVGNFIWVNSPGGRDPNCSTTSIACDAFGNSFIGGYFSCDTLVFGGTTLIGLNDGLTLGGNTFLVKYNANGNALWAKCNNQSCIARLYDIATDPSGNVFVTGEFSGPFLVFNSDTLFNTNPIAGNNCYYIAKYDSDGNYLWLRTAQTVHSHTNSFGSSGFSLATDISGNVFVSGTYCDSFFIFGIDTLRNDFIHYYNYNAFIAKYDANGNIIWAKNTGINGNINQTLIAIDQTGMLYEGGAFLNPQIIFENDTIQQSAIGEYSKLFLAKYDTTGNLIWVKNAGDSCDAYMNGIEADNFGNIYIGGYYDRRTITFGTDTFPKCKGYTNCFLAKFDSSGNFRWVKTANDSAEDNISIAAVSCDPTGSIYIIGSYSRNESVGGEHSLSISVGQDTILNPYGRPDMFFAKYSQPISSVNPLNRDNVDLILFPNPTTRNITIKSNKSEIASIAIYDITGNLVYFSQPINNSASTVDIKLPTLPSGSYLLRVQNENCFNYKRFVICN